MLLRYNKLISFLLVLFFCTPSFANFNPNFWPYIQERMFGVRTAVDLPIDNDELTKEEFESRIDEIIWDNMW